MRGHIRERSPGHWAIVIDVRDAAGRRKRKWHSFKGTKREAQSESARLISELNGGTYVEPSKLTVEQHLRSRLAQWEASGVISAKTAERYGELIVNQIVPHLGAKPIQKLRTIDIEGWHNTLAAAGRKDGTGGVSSRTIGHAHRVLSKALRDGARFDLVTKNVAAIERAPKVNDDDEIVIIEEQRISEFLTKLRGRPSYCKAIAALFTGMRRGELLALRWEHLDLDAKTLQIREALEETKAHGVRIKKPKTKAGRRDITLPEIVIDALRAHRRDHLEFRLKLGLGKIPDGDFVFPSLNGGPLSPRAFSAEWGDVASSIGMPDITFHALRHTHASQLIDAGIDVVTISRRLGHASPAITLKVYAHLFRKRDDKAADAINAALANLGTVG